MCRPAKELVGVGKCFLEQPDHARNEWISVAGMLERTCLASGLLAALHHSPEILRNTRDAAVA